MARSLSFIAKYFLGALFAMTLFFVIPHTAQAIGWDDGTIAAEHISFAPYSNGVVATITIKVDPPTNDVDHNGSFDNTAAELGRWIYINGGAGVDNLNTEGFQVEIATDNQFSNIVINHDLSVNTNLLRTVIGARIAPPVDAPLTPATHYFGRVVGLNAGNLTKVTLISGEFTTLAAGRDLDSSAQNLDTNGNQIVDNGNNTTAQDLSTNDGLPKCGVIGTESSVMGCVAQIIYYIIFTPTSYIMTLSGEIMDWGLGYSIDSNSYPVQGETFVTNGWRIMRDLANMLFIFILVYIAITTILGNGSARNIGMVILVALIINFSLFFTKVIIDVGNIMARVFYNQIAVCSTTPWQAVNQAQPSNSCERSGFMEITGTGEYKSVSYGFAAVFNPIRLFSTIDQGITLNAGAGGGEISAGLGTSEFAGFFALFSFIGALVNLVAAFVFFSLAWLFIGRVVALWLAMIFAPLAFIGLALPKIGGISSIEQFNIGKWWEDLFKNSMMPAIAMIMIFLITMFLKRGFLGQLDTATTTTGKFMAVLVPLIVITILLLAVKKTAQSLSGKIGETMGKVGGFVGGAALGLATGGAAFIGRRTIGAGAASMAESSTMKDWAANSRVGKYVMQGARNVSNSTFDARNVKVAGKDLAGATKWNTGKVESKGYIKDEKAKAKEQLKFADTLGASEIEKRKQNQMENEAKRKEIYMKRGEIDPYTGKVPTQAEVDEAKQSALNEKNRLTSVTDKRREKYAQMVEQGENPIDYWANQLSPGGKKWSSDPTVMTKKYDELRKRTAESARLQGIALGTIDPTTGKAVTQKTLDDAQKRITAQRYEISQMESGSVKAFHNNTAEEIRRKVKAKKTLDKDATPAQTAEYLQELLENQNKKDEKKEDDKKEDTKKDNKPYSGTNAGFKPDEQPKEETKKKDEKIVNTPQTSYTYKAPQPNYPQNGPTNNSGAQMSGIFNQKGPTGQVTNNPGGNTSGIGQTRMSGAGFTMKTFNNVGSQSSVNTAAGTTRSDYNGIKPSIDGKKDINIKTGGDSSVNFGKGSTVNINMPEGEGRAVTREELYGGRRFGFQAPNTNQIRTVTSQSGGNQRQEIGFRADRSQMSAGDKSADIAKEIGFRGAQTRQDLGINNAPSVSLNPDRTVVKGFGGAAQAETPVQKTGDQLIREKLLNEARSSVPTPPPKPPEQK